MSDVQTHSESESRETKRAVMKRRVTEDGRLAVFAPGASKDADPIFVADPADYPDAIRARLVLQGLSYKLMQGVAADGNEPVESQIAASHAALCAGVWSEPGGSSGRTPILVEAAMRAFGKTREAVEIAMERAKAAGIDIALDERVSKALAAIRRERKGLNGKAGKEAVDSLFG